MSEDENLKQIDDRISKCRYGNFYIPYLSRDFLNIPGAKEDLKILRKFNKIKPDDVRTSLRLAFVLSNSQDVEKWSEAEKIYRDIYKSNSVSNDEEKTNFYIDYLTLLSKYRSETLHIKNHRIEPFFKESTNYLVKSKNKYYQLALSLIGRFYRLQRREFVKKSIAYHIACLNSLETKPSAYQDFVIFSTPLITSSFDLLVFSASGEIESSNYNIKISTLLDNLFNPKISNDHDLSEYTSLVYQKTFKWFFYPIAEKLQSLSIVRDVTAVEAANIGRGSFNILRTLITLFEDFICDHLQGQLDVSGEIESFSDLFKQLIKAARKKHQGQTLLEYFYKIKLRPCLFQRRKIFREEQIKKIQAHLSDRKIQLIGISPAVEDMLLFINDVQDEFEDETVLLLGESGTGKTLLAEAIHYCSPRRDGPFKVVPCGALPEHLIESELFGHEKGAFTGAISQKKGNFEIANGGTIFLDEIGELPELSQVKFFRVLQDKKFTRLGGEEDIKTDARVIAATDKDLKQEMANGNFRKQLYYRIQVLFHTIPPLRERKEDIIPLTEFFLNRINERRKLKPITISNEAIKLLMNYNWPGNIRELDNFIKQSAVNCTNCKDDCIFPNHLPVEITGNPNEDEDIFAGDNYEEVMDKCKEKYLARKYKEYDCDTTKLARAIKRHRVTVHNDLKKYGIK